MGENERQGKINNLFMRTIVGSYSLFERLPWAHHCQPSQWRELYDAVMILINERCIERGCFHTKGIAIQVWLWLTSWLISWFEPRIVHKHGKGSQSVCKQASETWFWEPDLKQICVFIALTSGIIIKEGLDRLNLWGIQSVFHADALWKGPVS